MGTTKPGGGRDESEHLSLFLARTPRDELYDAFDVERRLDDPDLTAEKFPPDWAERKRAIYSYYDGACGRCGTDLESGWHCHHVREYDDGNGTHALENLAPLCEACHQLLHPFMGDAWMEASMFPADDADPRLAVERRPLGQAEDRWYADEYIGGEESWGGRHNHQSRSSVTTRVPAVAGVQKDSPTDDDLARVESSIADDQLTRYDPDADALPIEFGPTKAGDDDGNVWMDARRTLVADRFGRDDVWRDSSSGDARTAADSTGTRGQDDGVADPEELLWKHEGTMMLGLFGMFLVGLAATDILESVGGFFGGPIQFVVGGIGALVFLATAIVFPVLGIWAIGVEIGKQTGRFVSPHLLVIVPVAMLWIGVELGPPLLSLFAAIAIVSVTFRLAIVVTADASYVVDALDWSDDDGFVTGGAGGAAVFLAGLPPVLAWFAGYTNTGFEAAYLAAYDRAFTVLAAALQSWFGAAGVPLSAPDLYYGAWPALVAALWLPVSLALLASKIPGSFAD